MTRPLATIKVLKPKALLQEFNLTQATFTLGADSEHLISLKDPSILPTHAEFTWDAPQYMIRPLGKAEIAINDQPILAPHFHALKDGDLIQMGEVQLQFMSKLLPSTSKSELSSLPGTIMGANDTLMILQVMTDRWTQDFPLEGNIITLGRGQHNDCVIEEEGVAPEQLRLEKMGESYEIIDLTQSEALRYHDSPIQSHCLKDGDRLTLASTVTLIFQSIPAANSVDRIETLDLRECRILSIGRDPRNQTVVDHPLVSRFHARIVLHEGQWQVEDLNSSNGTFVNNQIISHPYTLSPGDTIRVGPYQFSFSFDETLVQQTDIGNLRLDAIKLNQQVANLTILNEISLSILPKEFVAIVGVSGAGKSTLLNALNGYQPATQGRVCVNGQDLYKNFNAYRMSLGYVPQDDIIHGDLEVRQALDFSARLRLPSDVSAQERSRQVQSVLEDLELQHRQDVPVKQLSGGQRKRVSIGVELLTKPSLFFLDEATSGLDPGTETQMMRLLRRLADQGRTIMLVTHATKNVMICDRVVFLAKGGRLAFYGAPEEALQYFEVEDFDEIYLKVEEESTPEQWQQKFLHSDCHHRYIHNRQLDLQEANAVSAPKRKRSKSQSFQKSGFRQWWILSQRTLALLLQDRASLLVTLSVAPLLGLLDFAMWRQDIFDPLRGDVAQSFTVLFVSVLIAVIVGSLATMREIVKESEIYRRERMMGLRIFPYIFSKLWFCVVLALYESAIFFGTKMLSVDFPISPLESIGIYLTLFLATLGGMVMGLLVSALSPNQSVAPLLTILFLVPQITFAGSILPLRVLGPVGQGLSQITISRWAYESMISLSNVGKDIAADTCWLEPEEIRDQWGDEQKQDCSCLGENLFKQCQFPGLWKQYDPAVDQAEPTKPNDPGDPPPIPEDVQSLVSGEYADDLDRYNKTVEAYRDELDTWQDEFRVWKENRGKAIAAAEELLQRSYRNQSRSYRLNVWQHWGRLMLIIGGMLILLAWVQKRKDTF